MNLFLNGMTSMERSKKKMRKSRIVFSSRWSKVKQAKELNDWQLTA
jgi:hypothetical protein